MPNWETKIYPPDGTWCWVTDDPLRQKANPWAWIVKRDKYCANGWGNGDTWEDFRCEIKGWLPIDPPEGYVV